MLAQVPAGMQPVVFHTAVTPYLTEEQLGRLNALADGTTHVAAEEGRAEAGFALEVDGREVGLAHPHGRWLVWNG